jgi:hypothetical protein
MAWTDPKTWDVGEVLTASDLNTHLRDDLDYLHDNPPYALLDSVSNSSYAGWGSEADLLTGTAVDYDGRKVTIQFSCSQIQPQGNQVVFKLYRDTTLVAVIAQCVQNTTGPGYPIFGELEDTPSAGSHTYKVTETATAGSQAPVQGTNRLRVRAAEF